MAFIFYFLGVLSLSALTPQDIEKLDKVKVLIVYKDNINELWDFLTTKKREYQVIDLRVGERYISTDLFSQLRNWVNSGGGIIVYAGRDDTTCSACAFFPEIKYEDLENWESRVFKVPDGLKNPVVTNVKKVMFVVSRIPIIGDTTGKIVILQDEASKTVAFISNMGRGRIAFLPTNVLVPYWKTEFYDNERLFLNLYRWLAGRNVPP
ncbi:MAG: hypothetical protein ACPLSJ_06840 [Thermosulfidibacteraceae bacterium]